MALTQQEENNMLDELFFSRKQFRVLSHVVSANHDEHRAGWQGDVTSAVIKYIEALENDLATRPPAVIIAGGVSGGSGVYADGAVGASGANGSAVVVFYDDGLVGPFTSVLRVKCTKCGDSAPYGCNYCNCCAYASVAR